LGHPEPPDLHEPLTFQTGALQRVLFTIPKNDRENRHRWGNFFDGSNFYRSGVRRCAKHLKHEKLCRRDGFPRDFAVLQSGGTKLKRFSLPAVITSPIILAQAPADPVVKTIDVENTRIRLSSLQ
jgi:hypothetical protein